MAFHANMNRDEKKRAKPYQPDDFMPKKKSNKEMTEEEIYNSLKAIFGNKVKQGKKS